MKKILAIITVAMLTISMASCSSTFKKLVDKAKEEAKKASSSTVSSEVESTADSKEESKAEDSDASSEESADGEKVLYDADGIKITYTGISNSTLLSQKRTNLDMLIENNSDEDIYVQVRNFAANGHAVGTVFSPRVSAGEEKSDKISIKDDELEENGIEELEAVEFKFYIFEAGDWTKSVDSDIITLSISDTGDDGESSEAKAEESSAAQTTDASKLVGKWKYDEYGITAVYEFKEDGTGSYDFVGTKMNFKYTAENGKLGLSYTGYDKTEFDYEINGDTLNVKDSFGNDTLYKKQ